jgi:cytochrome c oxidase cbb3-type subunit 3
MPIAPLALRAALKSGVVAATLCLPAAHAGAQGNSEGGVSAVPYTGGSSAEKLLGTPVTHIFPGAVPVAPEVKSPVGDDAKAIQRGMEYFTSMNCVGCHAANGGGGMGPALSNNIFIYGDSPANIYLTIYQGRPRGMPAWGAMLPDNVIWDLVAYIQNISQDMTKSWGTTVSASAPQIEQVPAEYFNSANPWSQTQPFSYGQKPNTAR